MDVRCGSTILASSRHVTLRFDVSPYKNRDGLQADNIACQKNLVSCKLYFSCY
jgi:hypothetical protein